MIVCQLEVARDIISVESISAVAVLLLFCAYLFYDRNEMRKELKEARKENKEKDEMISGFVEKYHIIATRLHEWLK